MLMSLDIAFNYSCNLKCVALMYGFKKTDAKKPCCKPCQKYKYNDITDMAGKSKGKIRGENFQPPGGLPRSGMVGYNGRKELNKGVSR